MPAAERGGEVVEVGVVAGEARQAEQRHAAPSSSQARPIPSGVMKRFIAAHRYSGCAMPRMWKPPSTKITSPVVQAPSSEAR